MVTNRVHRAQSDPPEAARERARRRARELRAGNVGWLAEPTPLAPLDPESRVLVKRDDLAGPFQGGSKTRKLDAICTAPRWREAQRWAVVGAAGSGHVASTVRAAAMHGKVVDAYLFDTPMNGHAHAHLAATLVGAARVSRSTSPAALFARYPSLAGRRVGGAALIPGGGTCAEADRANVAAGFELAAQLLAHRAASAPSRVYVPLGSGGTALGVAVGLAGAGLDIEVHAVDVVGRPVTARLRVAALVRRMRRAARVSELPRLVIRRDHLGDGYALPTRAGNAGANALAAAELPGEGVYSGKAFACLRADQAVDATLRAVFWMTAAAPPEAVALGTR